MSEKKPTGLSASTLFRAYESAYFTLKLYRGLEDKYRDRPEYEAKRFRQHIYFLGKFNQKLEANEKELELLRRQVEQFELAFVLQEIRAGRAVQQSE